MNVSSSITDRLLSQSSVKTLSKRSGATSKQVEKVVSAALPLLMQGMKNNSKSKSGEESLLGALSDHKKTDVSDIAAFLTGADSEDGNKIVKHVLGGNKTDIESALAKKSGASKTEVKSILSTLAPALLSLIGSQVGSSSSSSGSSGVGSLLTSLLGAEEEDDDNDVDLGGIASLLLGGSSSGSSSSSSSTGSILNLLLNVFGDND